MIDDASITQTRIDDAGQTEIISQRKSEHIALCSTRAADFRGKSTLLEDVQLVHDALPELHLDEVDLDTPLLGRTLRAPIVISAMTGGTTEAERINRDLAVTAEHLGLAFGLGSQRAMLLRPETTRTYRVRDVAPHVLILGNLGLVQARQTPTDAILRLLDQVGADALCLHLNPAMELVQPAGDRDFRDGLRTIERLRRELDRPLVVKETGCGISRRVGLLLRDAGVDCIDVSGAGGTSWVGVETQRAQPMERALGEALWDWGIPTAASVACNADLGFDIIATGGLRSGNDAVSAIALGATAAGFAGPVLRAYKASGTEGVIRYLGSVITVIRAVSLLAGCRSPRELRSRPRVLAPRLSAWIDACLRTSTESPQ